MNRKDCKHGIGVAQRGNQLTSLEGHCQSNTKLWLQPLIKRVSSAIRVASLLCRIHWGSRTARNKKRKLGACAKGALLDHCEAETHKQSLTTLENPEGSVSLLSCKMGVRSHRCGLTRDVMRIKWKAGQESTGKAKALYKCKHYKDKAVGKILSGQWAKVPGKFLKSSCLEMPPKQPAASGLGVAEDGVQPWRPRSVRPPFPSWTVRHLEECGAWGKKR